MFKMKFLTGLGIGYVLGARGGRERYDKLIDAAKQAVGHPRVQKFLGTSSDDNVGDDDPRHLGDEEDLGSDRGAGVDARSAGRSAASGAARPARGSTAPAGAPGRPERGGARPGSETGPG